MPTFDNVFLAALDQIRQSHREALIGGSIKSMEDYKKICGYLMGLDAAETEYKRLTSAVEENDSL